MPAGTGNSAYMADAGMIGGELRADAVSQSRTRTVSGANTARVPNPAASRVRPSSGHVCRCSARKDC